MALYDTKKIVVAVKYNGAVAGANAIPISSPDIRLNPEVATGSFKCVNGKLGNKTTWANSDDVTVNGASMEGFLTGNDATGTALATLPYWDEVYKVCGLTATVVASTSVTYAPDQAQPSDASTLAIWRDGTKRTLNNVLGSLVISGNVGEPIKQTATVSGFTALASTVEVNPTSVCINEALLLVLKSIDTLTVGGTAYKAQSFALTQGNDIQKLYMMGTKDFERVDFDSSLEITYLKENETIYADFLAGTSLAIVINAGSVNGKRCKITCGQSVVEALEEVDINGKAGVKIKFNLKGDATGINQFQIKFGNIA